MVTTALGLCEYLCAGDMFVFGVKVCISDSVTK